MAEYRSAYTGQEIDAGIAKANTAIQDVSNKVDKVEGKGLSTNDYTTEEKAKLADIDMSSKQDTLVSGTNIKTINGNSILGEGNLVIEGGEGGLSSVAHDNTLTGAGTNASPLGVDTTKFVSNTDYAGPLVGGVVKVSEGEHGITVDEGVLKGSVKTVTQYENMSSKGLVAKGTLENVLEDKGYQEELVSGTNIKTINNESILGSGNIDIQGGSGLSATAKALLITILSNGVYTSDQSTNISALQSALAGGGGEGYVISAILQNVSIDNDNIIVQPNSSYTAHLTADTGYTLDTVTVTMGGLDITSTAYSNGTVSIATVTANVTIMATATENASGGFVYDPTKWLSNKSISVGQGGEIVDTNNCDTYSEKVNFIKDDKLKVTTSASLGILIYYWDENDNFVGKAGGIWLTESNNYTAEYVGNKNDMAKIMFTTNTGISNPSSRVVSMEVE